MITIQPQGNPTSSQLLDSHTRSYIHDRISRMLMEQGRFEYSGPMAKLIVGSFEKILAHYSEPSTGKRDLNELKEVASSDILNHTQAAQYINKSISTLYHYTSKGIIPYYKDRQGRGNNYHKEDLDAFLLNHRIDSDDERMVRATINVIRKSR